MALSLEREREPFAERVWLDDLWSLDPCFGQDAGALAMTAFWHDLKHLTRLPPTKDLKTDEPTTVGERTFPEATLAPLSP